MPLPASTKELVVSVFGPSGAGKSTLVRALAAERNPDFPEWPALLEKHWECIAHPPDDGLPAQFAERLVLDGLRPVHENVGIVRAHLATFFAATQRHEKLVIT